ncbi:MAG: malate dehydrogenase [Armatimonadetes bacterium]|nr:malate dehydrogenase [Armatimonadota bacterium]
MRKKVTVVGAGNVGATVAQRIAERHYADVVLLDIVEGMPQGKALDLMQSGPIEGYDSHLTRTQNYEDSDVVVVTSGLPRKPGMSRDDLLFANMDIIKKVTTEVVRTSPKAIMVMISNPLDAMTQLAFHISKFPKNRVMGMAGVLDSARFRTFIAMELDVSVEDVQALVLGGHGDSMVPLPRFTTVAGVPITELLDHQTIARLVDRTRNGGAEIVGLLKTGSAFYAPAASAVQMVDSIMLDKKRVLPCCCYLEGEYGIRDLYVGVPAKLGASGVEKVLELKLDPKELVELQNSAKSVKELVDKMISKVG